MKLGRALLALPLLIWAALVVMVVALLLSCIALLLPLLSPLLRLVSAMARMALGRTGGRAARAHRQGAAE